MEINFMTLHDESFVVAEAAESEHKRCPHLNKYSWKLILNWNSSMLQDVAESINFDYQMRDEKSPQPSPNLFTQPQVDSSWSRYQRESVHGGAAIMQAAECSLKRSLTVIDSQL